MRKYSKTQKSCGKLRKTHKQLKKDLNPMMQVTKKQGMAKKEVNN